MNAIKIILASASPRRSELLKELVREFEIIPSSVDEEILKISPDENAIKLAEAKATDIAEDHKYAVVIGADTIVWMDDIILGKPTDETDAFRMLRILSGKEHHVTTGVALISNGYRETKFASTKVRIKSLTDEFIKEYIETGIPMDKAGAYAIQSADYPVVESYSGSYSNVVGLPMELLKEMWDRFIVRKANS